MKNAECHEDRPNFKDGLCRGCYTRQRTQTRKPVFTPTEKAERACASATRYAAKNPDKVKKYQAFWRKANAQKRRTYEHKRRAALNGVSCVGVSPEEFRAKCEEHGNRCWYCFSVQDSLTRDHVMPISLGGLDNPDNVVPACKRCNASKKNKRLEVWLDLPLLGEFR